MAIRRTRHRIANDRGRQFTTLANRRGGERPTLGRTATANRALAPAVCVACLAGLLAFGLIGCGAASSGEAEGHHHPHSHAERRATFADSVAEIQRRSARFKSDQTPTDAATLVWKRRLLVDVVRKLPELAAETDLKRPEWDRVAAISKELLATLQPQADSSETEPPLDRDRIAALVAELEQMAALNKSLGP